MKKLLLSIGILALLSSCSPEPICNKIQYKDQVLYRYFFTFDTGEKVEVHEVEYKHYNVGMDYCGEDYRKLN